MFEYPIFADKPIHTSSHSDKAGKNTARYRKKKNSANIELQIKSDLRIRLSGFRMRDIHKIEPRISQSEGTSSCQRQRTTWGIVTCDSFRLNATILSCIM